jgi:hypothetical protein
MNVISVSASGHLIPHRRGTVVNQAEMIKKNAAKRLEVETFLLQYLVMCQQKKSRYGRITCFRAVAEDGGWALGIWRLVGGGWWVVGGALGLVAGF